MKFIMCIIALSIMGITSVWSQIDSEKIKIKVGLYDNPPKIFMNEKGKPDGIFIDILESISVNEHLQVEYVYDNWSNLYAKLINGEIDILPDMAFSQGRDSLFQFSMPVLNSWLQVFTTKKTMINKVTELHNKRIGVLKASTQEDYLRGEFKKKYNIDYLLFTYDSYVKSVNALKAEEIDVIIANRFFTFSDLCDENIFPSGVLLQFSDLHFAFSEKTSHDIIEIFDKNIANLKNNPNSEFYTSLQKWFNINKFIVPNSLKWVVGSLTLFLAIFLSFTFLLNFKVKAKTRILEEKNIELIAAKEKAEEHDRLKTVFLQNLSHEIRTPMNGILGFVSLLQDSKITPEYKEQYLEIIHQSGERLLKTINDIIEMSKIESNQVVPRYSQVDIDKIMDFHLNFFKEQAKRKGLSIAITKRIRSEQTKIETDESLLNAILTNLLINAVKFTLNGSIEFGNYLDDNKLVFFVKDSGIGIPKDRQEAIFERFVFSDLKISRSHEGSGLGLAIVKAHVQLLNGAVWLESEVNIGSTFYFSLPYRKVVNEFPNIETNQNNAPEEDQITVLIAEDDDVSFLYLKTLLKSSRFKLYHGTTGLEAVQLLKDNPSIDLVLMDIKMPIMSGIEATKEIRKFNTSIPIIAQTAYIMHEDKESIIQIGCNDIVTKPINKSELFQKIEDFIRKK